jgi:hypothetical protein
LFCQVAAKAAAAHQKAAVVLRVDACPFTLHCAVAEAAIQHNHVR